MIFFEVTILLKKYIECLHTRFFLNYFFCAMFISEVEFIAFKKQIVVSQRILNFLLVTQCVNRVEFTGL